MTDTGTGLRPGDQIFLVDKGEVGGAAALVRTLRQNPESTLTILRGSEASEVQVVRYRRPALDVDFPYLILALIGVVYLLIGLYTLLRQRTAQGFVVAMGLALVGYTPDRFIVRNSWGTGWGDRGFAYASLPYAQEAFTEAYGIEP